MVGKLNSTILVPAPAPIARGRGRLVPGLAAQGATSSALAQSAFGDLVEESASDERDPAAEGDGGFDSSNTGASKRPAATETLGRRAGALSDELDFTDFVASLVHGTFDAIVDSSIRQMESFADLVAAVSKPIGQFAEDNVSLNQARDWLIERYPSDLELVRDAGGAHVAARGANDDSPPSPDWLADFGAAGEELTPELIEEKLVPAARERAATDRVQTLATMVLLGMNRVVVKDGTIAARLRFRAAAADKTSVDYAVSDDPNSGGKEWGRRGARTYAAPSTKVSTIGVNAQSDTELKAELFGEVRINFASETVPLERFVDDARRVMLERHAKVANAPAAQARTSAAPSLPPAPSVAPPPDAAAVVVPAEVAPSIPRPPASGGPS